MASNATMLEATSGRICEKGNRGPVLPLFGDAEQEWPRGLRVVLYLLGLLWCFMGVGIVSDVFMTAIEKVTSKKMRRFDSKKGRWYTYEVWNSTVANLTLMALGSSAPEILLNVIDIFAKEFFLEGLGPSTIVGSAAFNLLMIIAVCIVALPAGEVRKIKDMGVYACTATWSILAYLWLLVILILISPDVVEVWEGVVTFLFFPILTCMAFALDKGWVGAGSDKSSKVVLHEQMTPEEVAEAFSQVRKQHGENLTDDQVARIMALGGDKARSRAQYRVGASRSLFGGKKPQFLQKTTSLFGGKSTVTPFTGTVEPAAVTFFFPACKYAVLENCGHVRVTIGRSGDLEIPAEVYYTTVEGSAKAGADFTAKEGWLRFEAGEAKKDIDIAIMDDDAFETDESFQVKLTMAKTDDVDLTAEISKDAEEASITIVDDDLPGVISFATEKEQDLITVIQQDKEFVTQIPVQRRHGSCGEVRVKYYTESATAIAGRDFETTEGVLVFADQQMEARIDITINAVPRYDKSDEFRIFLAEPEGGAKLDSNRDGGEEKNILTAMIQADESTKQKVDHVTSLLKNKWDKSKIGHANWASQFKAALSVNGDDDDDDEGDSKPSIMDYATHIITLPWKLMFACVPPIDYCGGWLCFFCALLGIGIVTMIINDMASLLGCVMCIPDDITAITFVALGTSLPDTFASMSAAKGEPYADSSVGNVTGSNSVNVFLGLGLPWMIASLAWAVSGESDAWHAKYQNKESLTSSLGAPGTRSQVFVVESGSLSFSVAVFSACAVICIGMLAVRRKFCGGELGGDKKSAYASSAFLGLLWLVYITASAVKSLELSGGGCTS